MKQLALKGISPFPPEAIDAPDEVVTACMTEADAVRWCVQYAHEKYGVSQRTIAKLCGWKSSSFLSEIANPENPKAMPQKCWRKFGFATGLRLVEQYHARQATIRRMTHKETARDRSSVVMDMLRHAA